MPITHELFVSSDWPIDLYTFSAGLSFYPTIKLVGILLGCIIDKVVNRDRLNMLKYIQLFSQFCCVVFHGVPIPIMKTNMSIGYRLFALLIESSADTADFTVSIQTAYMCIIIDLCLLLYLWAVYLNLLPPRFE